jgi:5-methyltetrahydrofolate--homocysteine methyltransferase
MSSGLKEAVIELREDDALRITEEELKAGTDPLDIVADCREAMDVIGKRFADGEAFIPELIMAGEIMTGVSVKLKPHLLSAAPEEKLGVVVIGTVQGDIHDIGKDIVATMLDIAGFDVVDLGVDVKVDRFVEAAGENHAQIIAMSCLLTSAIDAMKKVVAAAGEAGIRGDVKLMVGGAPITDQVVAYTGADGFGKDAVEAVELAKQWIGGK